MANHIYLLIVITLDSPHSGPEQVDSCRVIDTFVCASQSRLLSLFAGVSLFSRALSLLTSSTPLPFSLSGETLTHTCIIVVELELERKRERGGEIAWAQMAAQQLKWWLQFQAVLEHAANKFA